MGALPPARGETPAPCSQSNGYSYKRAIASFRKLKDENGRAIAGRGLHSAR
jgi:hypothetical protein